MWAGPSRVDFESICKQCYRADEDNQKRGKHGSDRSILEGLMNAALLWSRAALDLRLDLVTQINCLLTLAGEYPVK